VALHAPDAAILFKVRPGTGKSQTITNLIADYVARGKRVLFVCESAPPPTSCFIASASRAR